jgi:hypothetical protein
MIEETEDQDLRALLRSEFAPTVEDPPEFGAVWAAAGRRHRFRCRVKHGLAIAAMAVACTILAVMARAWVKPAPREFIHVPDRESADLPWRSAILLTEWRAPSDVLLPAEFQP